MYTAGAAKFLAHSDNRFSEVINARSTFSFISALDRLPAVQMSEAATISLLVGDCHTERVRQIVGDFSSLVVFNTDGGIDEEYMVIRYDDGKCEWGPDSRFGVAGTVSHARLNSLWEAFGGLVINCCGLSYLDDPKDIKDALEDLHAKTVTLSTVVGAQKAMEMFAFCLENMNHFTVLDADKTGDNRVRIVYVKDRYGRLYRAGTRSQKKNASQQSGTTA